MKKNEIVDILPEILDVEYAGMNFNEALRKSTIQSRIIRILGSKENNWMKPLFDMYKSVNDRNVFLQKVNGMADKHGFELKSLNEILDINILMNVFDAIDRIKPDEDLSIPAPTKELKAVTDNAENVCVIIDKLAREISKDSDRREKYISSSEKARQLILHAELQSLEKQGKLSTNDKNERVKSLNKWLPYYTLSADTALLNKLSQIKEENELERKVIGSIEEIVEKDEKWLENSREQSYEETTKPTDEKEEKLVKFGDVYPRPTPQSKISKMLQPYNIKVGIKFLNAIIDAFNDVLVRENGR